MSALHKAREIEARLQLSIQPEPFSTAQNGLVIDMVRMGDYYVRASDKKGCYTEEDLRDLDRYDRIHGEYVLQDGEEDL